MRPLYGRQRAPDAQLSRENEDEATEERKIGVQQSWSFIFKQERIILRNFQDAKFLLG